jgi:hypothetical protein
LKNSSVREKECMLFRQLKKTLFKTGALKWSRFLAVDNSF